VARIDIVVMEDASAILSLPDDPQSLKQIILNLSRESDDWHVKFLRVETELLRLRKWYYGRGPTGSRPPATWRKCCWLSQPSWNRGR
jgi:hypothetical protein